MKMEKQVQDVRPVVRNVGDAGLIAYPVGAAPSNLSIQGRPATARVRVLNPRVMRAK
jgi:hypothetical protein